MPFLDRRLRPKSSSGKGFDERPHALNGNAEVSLLAGRQELTKAPPLSLCGQPLNS